MNIKERKGLLVVIPLVMLALAFVMYKATAYNPRDFKGGVSMRDSGLFSYPRYRAELGQVPLSNAGESEFTISGLPSAKLDLALPVSDATYSGEAELTGLLTSLTVSVADSSGKLLCAGEGKLSDAKRRGLGSWVLASSSSHASFWHPRCLELPIRRTETYKVKVKVSELDPRSPRKTITPMLQGGGIELP